MPLGRIERFDPDVLQGLMEKKGVTRAYLAAHAQVNPSVVSRWLTGAGSPSPGRAKRIADILDVDVLALSGKTMNTADIVDLRQRMGLTTAEVGELTGLTKQQIYEIEASITWPSDDRLAQLAPVYEQTLPVLRKAWINRRITRFGTESLNQIPQLRQQ